MKESKREFIKKTVGIDSPTGSLRPSRTGSTRSSVFNVMDFGAKGDGRTADSVAIQRALDAAGKIQGTVYFPSGTYRCHDLKVHSHTTILAEPQWGYGSTGGAILILDNTNADCVLNISDTYGCHIRGITIRRTENYSKRSHGIFLNNTVWSLRKNLSVIDEVSIQGFSGYGIYLSKVWGFIIRHSLISWNQNGGVCVHGRDGFVLDNQIGGNLSHGFIAEEFSSKVMFTANRIEWNRGYGVYLVGGDAWIVTGNCFDRNYGAAVFANAMNTSTFTGNIFRRNGKDATGLQEGTAECCQMLMQSCKGITVAGNVGFADADDGRDPSVIKVSPKYLFWIKDNVDGIVTDNAFWNGYTTDMILDKGGNHADFLINDNVGSIQTLFPNFERW